MATYTNYESSTTTSYYTYTNSEVKCKDPLYKQEQVRQRLREIPVFELLFDLGAFRTYGTTMLISEDKWEKIYKLFSSYELMHLAVKMINTSIDGLFFNSIPHQLVIIIYGIFDENISVVEKANYIKKAMYYLVPGGVLVLLSDKDSPDNLRDIVIFSAVETKQITELDLTSSHDIETRGLVLNKQ